MYYIDKAREKFKERKIVLQVRSWNKRTIKCYEKVSFRVIKTDLLKDHNEIETEFVFMEYDIMK